MDNDEQRDKRIDDLMRLNNKKYKQTKEQQQQKQFLKELTQKQSRYKLKEYAKHIQQINQRNIKLAKQRQIEKERQLKLKQKEKAQRKKKMEEDKVLKKQKQKQQIIKNRRRRNSLQIQQINKKVSQLAALELRRIKSGKILKETQKQIKKMKLLQLDQKRKNILSKTKKIPIQPPSDFIKQNKDCNIINNQNSLNILKTLQKQGFYQDYCPRQKIIHHIKQQQQQQQDSESEQQDSDDDFNYNEVKVQQSEQQYQKSQPKIPKFLDRKKQDIAKLLNSDDQDISQAKGFDQQIFFLSSDQLCKKSYLRI